MTEPMPKISMLLPKAASEAAAIVHMLERLMRDPSVDLDRVREALVLRTQVLSDIAREDFNRALAAAQSEMNSVTTDLTNPATKSKYASLFAVNKMLRPIYTKHGLAVSFDEGEAADKNWVRVLCTVSFGRHERIFHVDLPADGKGAKGGEVMTITHAVGSALSYGRRYLLLMIFNIAIGGDGEDDDGNAAGSGRAFVNDEQADQIRNLLIETKSNVVLFLKALKVESITQIHADKFNDVMNMIHGVAEKRAEIAKKRAAQEGGTS